MTLLVVESLVDQSLVVDGVGHCVREFIVVLFKLVLKDLSIFEHDLE
jgi:hypothetical protein